ncbi:MAG TPA: IgGFc-binding protein, partial [Cytophagaceae bacterium]
MKKIILILSFLFVTISGYSQVDQIFWFAAPSVTAAHGDLPIELRLASFNSVPANVTIDVPADNSFAPINITIAPMGSSLVDLSAFLNLLENRPNNTILNKGIRITATQPITAYYEVDRGGLNNEIFTLKGENALGTRFYTPFQTRYPINQNYYENASDPANSSFTIVATAPGATTVTIRLKAGKVAKGGTAAPQANSDFIITLNQGQTYTVFADGRLGVDRLDGTLITSDKAIAVTICDDSIEHPSIGAIDLTGDQIVPVNIVGDASGSEYLIARGFAGNNNDENIAYIVGTEANTQVTLNAGTTTATTVTIGAGQTYEYILSPEFVASKVVSTKPVYVLYLSGFGGELGSPLLPSIKCTGSSKVSFVRSSGNSFFLVILVQTEAIGSFTLEGYNNSVIVNEGYSSIPATTTSGNWSVKQIEVTDIEVGKAYTLSNTKGYFHLGIINGVRGGGSANFGYFSDFGKISTNLPGSLDICPNTSVKLDPQIFGYRSAKWYKNNQPISGGVGPNGELTFLADPNNSTGEYRVELEDNRSCKINDTVKIKVFPRIGFTLPAPPTNVCSNANYAINAPGDYVSYQWKFGTLATLSPITSNNGPKSHKPDKSGTYRVIITDLNGCKDSSQVVINYITTQLVKLNDPTSSFCSNGSSILTHQTPPTTFNSYLWKYNNSPAPGTNNEKTYRPNFTTSGSYTITLDVTDANGCASSDSKTINFVSNQGFNLGEDQTVVCTNSNYSIVVNGNYTNLIWDLNGAIFTPTSGAGGKTHKPVQGKNGTYTVKGKDVNGCDATDAVVIGKVVDSTGITLNTPPNNVCSNSGFQLEVSPGTLSSYTWYKGTTQVG